MKKMPVKRMNLGMPETSFNRLKGLSEQKATPMSALVREAIQQYLDREERRLMKSG